MQIVPIGLYGGESGRAGRKAPQGKTVVKRFPERYLTAVNALIEHLDEARNQDGIVNYESIVQCRNLDDTLITLQFQSRNIQTP
jgi:type VI protein secretion system component VasF